MAEAPAGSVSSIKSRIAALNLEEVHAPTPGSRPGYSYEQAAGKKAPPPPPPGKRPPAQQRQQTVNNPPILSNAPTSERQIGNQPIAPAREPKPAPTLPPRLPPRTNSNSLQQAPPSLPPRTNSHQASPALPPRKGSEYSIKRQGSSESISTIASGRSAVSVGSTRTSISGASNGGQLYHIKAPAYDPSKLPPLPPKKAPEESNTRSVLKSTKSAPNVVPNRTLPPQLPSRPALPTRPTAKARENVQPQGVQTVPPPRKSALTFGMNKSTEPPPLPTNRPQPDAEAAGAPPPVPRGSRPNLDAIMASKPKPGAAPASCLKCRDFSAVDSHAARFPRENLPSSDVGWLAHQLTSPFPSLTDKARVLFTWLHHNVEYDVHSFFSGTVSPSTPERTITTGLAVCEGYASLFTNLAMKSGLESVVIGGDGKGYGHHPLKPGDPIPPFSTNHAWNAVRIDNGEWKLIDCCWGAGNVQGPSMPYEKSFKPQFFTMDNDEFGCKHFPADNSQFFRTDGRPSITWEEYQMEDMGERLMVYGPATPDHGLGERTFAPAMKHIKVHDPSNPVVRFSFASVCVHWDNARNGKGPMYPMCLNVAGRDGRKTDWLPFNTDGKVWWLDVNRIDLGAPGQKVSAFAVTNIDGRDARGVTMEQYRAAKGKKAMGFGGVAMWELV